MKRLSLLASGLWAGLVVAAPLVERQGTNIDTTVLNFALTLEHLEDSFYKGALAKFSLADFQNAGYSATYYNNLKHIAMDEESHVKLLTAALQAAGATPVAACQYTFPYTDVASFITLSSVIEGVGTSAYLGGAPLITDKGYLTVAGSILVTEALHTSYQRAGIGEVPFPSPYGTPLDPTSVFTIASAFINNCPAGNPTLPFTPYPGLTYDDTQNCRCEEPDCAPSAAIKRDNDWGSWPADPTTTTTTTWAQWTSTTSNPVKPTSTTPASSTWNTWTTTKSKKPAKETTTTSASTWNTWTSSSTPVAATTTKPAKPAKTSTWTQWTTVTPAGPGASSMPAGPAGTVCPAGATTTVTVNGAQPTSGWNNWSGPGPQAGNGCAPPSAGATIKLTGAGKIPDGSYVTFVSGLNVVSAPGQVSGSDITVAIPDVVAGQAYVFVTSADVEKTLDASKILFGPAIVEVDPAAPTYDPNYIKA